MTESHNPRRAVVLRYALGTLLAFGALNAFAGGYYGLTGAQGVPREWLRGSPFTDYFVPSLAAFARWRHARPLALAAGVIVLGWLAIQIAVIGYVSWMQPATAIAGAIVLALAWRMQPPPRV